MATTKKQDLEIHFLSLELTSALKLPSQSNHLLSIGLVCPRLAVARKTSERTVALTNGVFAPNAPKWTESVLFKETVSGRFGFAVEVSEAMSDAEADAFFNTGASALVKLLSGFIGGALPVAALGEAAEIPFSSLSKAVTNSKTAVTLVTGCLDIAADASFQKRTVIEVPLVVAKDVYKMQARSSKSSAPSSRRKILSKGDAVGVCRLSLETL